jgi:hypothetical protein
LSLTAPGLTAGLSRGKLCDIFDLAGVTDDFLSGRTDCHIH